MITIEEAVLAINPSAQFTSTPSDNVDGITWLSGTTPISKSDILAKQAELQADYDAKKYQRDRAKAYPTWQDQLDMQYHDKKDGTTTWQDAVQAVKDAHPKP
jgi:phosphosulfolactate synthase (CoM biosynthesis protein A)|tara:strand:- start:37 stop:342 length:306 start_codon:yes stop_codon:yes gene_type:complete